MALKQIMLLPQVNYYQWAHTVQSYVLHFGSGITPDPEKASGKDVVSVIVTQNGYPEKGDIVSWLETEFPEVKVDPIVVESPADLGSVLQARIDRDKRFGDSFEEDSISANLQYPQDRLYLFWPTDYPTVLQHFGVNAEIYSQYGLPGHEGIDIRAPHQTNVYACAPGEVYRVDKVGTQHNYGKHVRIQHAGGYRTVYAHLDRVLVEAGDQVTAKQVIGRADSTGNSTGTHLHLSLKKDGATAAGETQYPGDMIDPTPYLITLDREKEVMAALDMAEKETDSFTAYAWTRPCLVGLNGRIGGGLETADFSVIETAKIEAVKIGQDTTNLNIKKLREINPDMFIMARMTIPWTREKISPEAWVDQTIFDINRLYKETIYYIEIEQSPNLQRYGWRSSWFSGEAFGEWWLAVVERLKRDFPAARFGFPGVSPGGYVAGQRMDAEIFLDGADFAIAEAEWVGVNCFWNSEAELNQEASGRFYEFYRQRYPEKLLFITEFGNTNALTNATVKAREYVKFYERVRAYGGIGAAFAQVASAEAGYDSLVWRTENGALTKIAAEVGKRDF